MHHRRWSARAPSTATRPSTLVWLVFGLFFPWGGATSLDDILVPATAALAPGQTERTDAEYAAEISYGVHVFSWFILRPNVQLVVHPGGYEDEAAVVILGMKGAVTF